MRLDFLVIGAQKCATSWFYLCLRDHPELHLPVEKKEVEYLGGPLHRKHGDAWYQDLTGGGAGSSQKVGDVSIEYIYDPGSARAVHERAPGVKLIASLRDPVERALSAFHWYQRKRKSGEQLALDEGVRALVDAEGEWADVGTEGWAWEWDVVSRGFYDVQLQRYLDLFGPEQIMVVDYARIGSDPAGSMEGVYRFLGVDPSFRPGSLGKRPKWRSSLNPLAALERALPRSRVVAAASDRVGQWLGRRGIRGRELRPSEEVLEALRERYRPHVEETEEILRTLPGENVLADLPLFRMGGEG